MFFQVDYYNKLKLFLSRRDIGVLQEVRIKKGDLGSS